MVHTVYIFQKHYRKKEMFDSGIGNLESIFWVSHFFPFYGSHAI